MSIFPERQPDAPMPTSEATGSRQIAFADDEARRIGSIRGSFGLVNRLVMAIDFVAVLLVILLFEAQIARGGLVLTREQAGLVAVVGALAVVTMLRASLAYRIERYVHLRRSLYDLARATFAMVVFFPALLWTYRPGILSIPDDLLRIALITFAALTAGRVVARFALHRMRHEGHLRRHVAIVGNNALGRAIAADIAANDREGEFTLVGIFDDAALAEDVSERQRRSAEDLLRIAQERRIDVIVLALPWTRADYIFSLTVRLQWISADLLVPVERSVFMPQALVTIGGTDMLLVAQHPLRGTEGLRKLLLDYAVAGAALVASAPVMLLAALAIRLSGDGPVIFRQPRLGMNGQLFDILKFRTMTVSPDDDGSVGATRNDPRITRIGRWLRQTSIDELPQLINVLKGDMSVVGPRPHVPGMLVEQQVYSHLVTNYAARHRLKPGITGWAQINGTRAGIDSIERAQRAVELDLYYIRNWSLRFDVHILMRTLGNLLGRDVF